MKYLGSQDAFGPMKTLVPKRLYLNDGSAGVCHVVYENSHLSLSVSHQDHACHLQLQHSVDEI